VSAEPGKGLIGRQRRGGCRAVAVFAAVALALAVGGCGDDGASATDSEKAADAEILNAALDQELTAARAYAHGDELLRGPFRTVGREFRAQAQEHADAITKAIRGLGGEMEAEPGELDYSEVRSQADFLAFAYGLENVALTSYLEATPQLETPGPRVLAAALAASHAQHLVVLRRGLGAGPAASVPEALEQGDLPPPSRDSAPAEPGS
jgi:bacterioferritin (cytochrome b1)